MMETNDHVDELIPAYVLGSLDYDDEIQVSDHLSTCDLCMAELHSYQRVVEELPATVNISQPSIDLKGKVMAQVSSRAQEKAGLKPESGLRRLLQDRGIAPVFGLTSLVLIFVLITSSIFLWLEVVELRAAGSTGFVSLRLEGTDFTPAASGVIIINQAGDYGTLIVDRLPVPPETHEYQLWLIEDGQRTSGGLFSVNDSGYGAMKIYTKKPLIAFSEFGITVEPVGGSDGPTGDKVLGGQF